ncbi:MAG: signal peptidase II [Bacilli bacterium]|nr:signal peptidase II [Bacilli bacterium]
MKKFYIIVILGILIDRILKILISSFVTEPIHIIKNFFYITYVKNDGAAFSILEGHQLLFVIIALIALALVFYYVKKNNIKNIGYAMVFSGIIGNLIDRLFFGYVIDFIGFNLFGRSMPIFNFADILIVIGAVIALLGSDKNEVSSN